MRFTLPLLILFLSSTAVAQESFKKKFYIPSEKKLKGGTTVFLTKLDTIYFKDFTLSERQKIESTFPRGSIVSYTKEEVIAGKKSTLTVNDTVNDAFYAKQFKIKSVPVKNVVNVWASVKFIENKVIINPYLVKKQNGTLERRGLYQFELQNRQTVKLYFNEVTVSGLIVPLKYRIKNQDAGIAEEFSSALNVNLFTGYSIGKTSFFHRDKVDNVTNTWKFTGGFLIGASTVTLNAINTSAAAEPLPTDSEIVKGLASVGVGLTYSFNKINVGGFYGYDYAIGDASKKWNYNKRPWLGIALGYSIFSF